jgi:hypothetical protein
MERQLLLIAGIPATGKSYFCRWLTREHGFIHVDVDSPTSPEARHILAVLKVCWGARTITAATATLGTLEPRVVVDWGFPPEQLPLVQRLKDAGTRLWWFDGDRDRARAEFVRRGTIPILCLDVQMAKIARSWEEIRGVFHPNIIDVLGADGQRRSPEEIWEHIVGHAG